MSHPLPNEDSVSNEDDELSRGFQKHEHPLGDREQPFDVFDPDQQDLFVQAVERMLSVTNTCLREQEQRTIRLNLDGDYVYVQAVVDRLRQVFNVTWVSAQPEPMSGRDVVWLVVIEWPEIIPKSDSSKPLTKAQWCALDLLYKQRLASHTLPIESAVRRSTLLSLLNRWPAFARLCPDNTENGRIEITEVGVTYYEIHKHSYLERHWKLKTSLPPPDNIPQG